nr:hypothetical protein [Anaerolineae bacterium]
MEDHLNRLTWSISDLDQALEALGRASGLLSQALETPPLPEGLAEAGGAELSRWLETTARRLDFEAEPVDTPYPEVEQLIQRAGPALLRLPLPYGETARFLALLRGGR